MTNVNCGSGGAMDKKDGSVYIGFMLGTFGENGFRFRLRGMKDAIPLDVDAAALHALLVGQDMSPKERQMVHAGWRLLRAKESMTPAQWDLTKKQQRAVWTSLLPPKKSIFGKLGENSSRTPAADTRGGGGQKSRDTQIGSASHVIRHLRVKLPDGNDYELRGWGWGESGNFEEDIKKYRYNPLTVGDDYAPVSVLQPNAGETVGSGGPKRHGRVGKRCCVCLRLRGMALLLSSLYGLVAHATLVYLVRILTVSCLQMSSSCATTREGSVLISLLV